MTKIERKGQFVHVDFYPKYVDGKLKTHFIVETQEWFRSEALAIRKAQEYLKELIANAEEFGTENPFSYKTVEKPRWLY